ncbi:transcription elongation factor SPT6 homolog [Mercurialis annua]|uniref:transcription elongation factor SPT6 homolog n=1 Tax=Mercurialis annua TaxID=3986 RepID=UPI00215E8BCB|nr:transcription elongation factor SPT6 homolog [Mercurialis annua]
MTPAPVLNISAGDEDEYEKDDLIVDSVEDDSEDDSEEEDEYEQDDFIVEDDIEEEEEERKKKKKKKKKRCLNVISVLDEEDYELLRDNNAFKKFKRLKKATAEERVEHDQLVEEEDKPDDIDDEMADFIVHEDEDGAPIRRNRLKKKTSPQEFGIASSSLQEAHELFGDVDDLLLRRKLELESSLCEETSMHTEFEPTVLSDKYMTEKDERIRVIDYPERMQISEETAASLPTDAISLSNECNWILNQLANGVVPLFNKRGASNEGNHVPLDRDDICRFLQLRHFHKLDVPFIAMYRKEECLSLLKDPDQHDDDSYDKSDTPPMLKWHKVLWAIHDLDRKWLLLQKRKTALESYYNKRFEEESRRMYDQTRPDLNQQLFESILTSLKAAESEREVEDVDAQFNLHFPPGEPGLDEGQYKRPKRKSQYSICSKAGLWDVANKFGFIAEQLGMALSLTKMGTFVETPKETPEQVASNFTCVMFKNPQAVLKGARHMAAVEISWEPSIRKHVRALYVDNCVVSTSPTPDGNSAIDAYHQLANVKWLREKPVNRFEDAQWLLIQKAEEDKLLQVTFKLPEKVMNQFIHDCEEHYLSDGVTKSAQVWNEQRSLILKDALHNFLLPSMEKEARSLLTSRAKNMLLWEYGKVLWNKVSVGPYQRKDNDISSDDEASPRVMACCWGPGKQATTFVMLDSSGEVLDVLYAGSLTLQSQNINDQQQKQCDQQLVLKFMTDHRPHVVVLGAVNLSCTRLKDDIYEIIFKMVENNPRDVGHEMDELSIVYGDEALPRLYENSRISSDQLAGQPGIVRRAVALGRYLQNPLAMVATLCGPAREILSWKLSPLENFLNSDEKYAMAEQVMVDVTNKVGLDVNMATAHEWLFAPLQFISGLGPRKAAFLQRSLVRWGAILTRKDFVTVHGLDKNVFVNAVGFLRVRRSGLAANSSQFIDLLDDTRIHPESYGLAQEMAKDVYEIDSGDANDKDEALEMAIEHARDRPNLLKSLKIDVYVVDKKRENKEETLKDIKGELIQGFQDWRKQYKEPTQDEEFYMISGETDETLAEGRTIAVTVRRLQGGKAICALESGLTGILTKEDYADDWRDIPELADRLHEGDMLTCKIKSIQKNRFQVFLVSKEGEMRKNRHQQVRVLDPYYHEDRSSLQSAREKARKEKALVKKHFKPRMIVHPRFQNITADEAMEFLSDKDPGESVVRPSSWGPSYLTLTLKVYDGVYAHKDIVEGGKEHKDITSLLRIGKTLKIGEDTFEDLDELMDRYVDPLVAHLKTMLSYRKFRRGTKAEVDEQLRVEKSDHPTRIVYSFGIAHEHPGTSILTYIRGTNLHHEYVGLYPEGFKFRKRMFSDINSLVSYFQRHIDDSVHESGPSIRSVAAMVPMRSPATGGLQGQLV